MKLLDILNAPWAIEPSKLLEIRAIYATHLRGEKIDIAAIEQKLGRPLANEPKGYDINNGVAVLPIDGVIAKKANLFTQISGGTSSQLIARDLQAALADPAVHSIILAIDSPGGSVDGTQNLADAVLAARDVKPIVSLASGLMASAAYWIGSAASAVYITDGTTNVGSIGVVTSHTDVSQAEAKNGLKTTEIYAGKYKRVASQYGPLSDAGRQTIQDMVDYNYSLFVSAVATNRGVPEKTVLKDMADGRVFIGQQAIDAGLVDGVSTLDALIAQLNQDRSSGQSSSRARAGVAPSEATFNSTGETMPTTREELAAQAPELLASVMAEGAAAERARIQAVEGQLIPGHEALIATLKFDGKSTAGDAAMAVNAAERSVRATHAARLAADAPAPLAHAAASADGGAAADAAAAKDKPALTRAEIDTKAKAHAKATGVSYVEAVKHIQATAAAVA